MNRDVLVLREDEIRSVLDMSSCMDAVERAFAAYAGGGAELPAVIHLNVPDGDGEVHVKAGYIHGDPIYATKFASSFAGRNDGVVLAFDASTGAVATLLFDNGFITDIRTGAAGGLAAKYLAREDSGVVAMIGTGGQVRYQLDALSIVRPFTEVRVWGRNTDRAVAAAARVAESHGAGAQISVSDSVEAAVRGADIVVTATGSSKALVLADWLSPGMHITALGSDGAGKQELEPAVLERADLIVADSRTQCLERGELQHVTGGVVGVAELGEIAAGTATGRTSSEQITVCDLTGVGVQDVAAASVVLERAREKGLGERLTI